MMVIEYLKRQVLKKVLLVHDSFVVTLNLLFIFILHFWGISICPQLVMEPKLVSWFLYVYKIITELIFVYKKINLGKDRFFSKYLNESIFK